MDQYRGGKGADRQQYLSLWSGQAIKADRKTGESVYARHPVACVVGGIQPDLAGDLHDAAQRRDGFVERILPIVPDVGIASWTDDAPSPGQYQDVLALFESLDRLALATDTSEEDEHAAGIGVSLAPEAQAQFVSWHNENAALMGASDGLAAGFFAKLPAHVARFALILHALWNPSDPHAPVAIERMRDAIELGEFSRAHIARFLALLDAATPPASAGVQTRIMRIIGNRNPLKGNGWVSRSDIYRGLRNVSAETLTDALTRLVEAEKIERRIDPGTTKPAEYYRVLISHYSQNPDPDSPPPRDDSHYSHDRNWDDP
jgi:hypothetical protein